MKRFAVVLLSLVLSVVALLGPSASPAESAITRQARAVHIALNQRGDPYVYGAAGPGAFDCSGLVYYSYRKAGFRHVPRTAAAQYRWSKHIRHRDLRRGDLIFDHDRSGHVFHVEIYLGHGKVVEAARPGVPVRVARVWKVPRYAGRVPHHRRH